MTANPRIFERRGSRGWVILAGESPSVRGSETSALDSIKHLKESDRALVVLAPKGEIPSSAQSFMSDFEALVRGGLKIYDPLEMTPALIRKTCQEAQLVLAMGGNREDWVAVFAEKRLPVDPDLIIAEKTVFVAIGSLVSLLGEWIYDPDHDQISDGIGWFPKAIFLLGPEAPGSKSAVRQKIETQMKSYALNLAPDTIIAVGLQGKVEIWSEAAPEILLGQGWV